MEETRGITVQVSIGQPVLVNPRRTGFARIDEAIGNMATFEFMMTVNYETYEPIKENLIVIKPTVVDMEI